MAAQGSAPQMGGLVVQHRPITIPIRTQIPNCNTEIAVTIHQAGLLTYFLYGVMFSLGCFLGRCLFELLSMTPKPFASAPEMHNEMAQDNRP